MYAILFDQAAGNAVYYSLLSGEIKKDSGIINGIIKYLSVKCRTRKKRNYWEGKQSDCNQNETHEDVQVAEGSNYVCLKNSSQSILHEIRALGKVTFNFFVHFTLGCLLSYSRIAIIVIQLYLKSCNSNK